jgi:hypothetical protein
MKRGEDRDLVRLIDSCKNFETPSEAQSQPEVETARKGRRGVCLEFDSCVIVCVCYLLLYTE